jgi:hypothetical protein
MIILRHPGMMAHLYAIDMAVKSFQDLVAELQEDFAKLPHNEFYSNQIHNPLELDILL